MSKILTTIKLTSYLALTMGMMVFAGAAHAVTLGQVAQIAQSATPAAFNAVELTASADAESHVGQWNRVKLVLGGDMKTLGNCLQNDAQCTTQAMKMWKKMMVRAAQSDEANRLNLVNSFFNQWSYISDQENYNTSEYWASPLEFMNNGGDCEDFAIAKYASLQLLGYGDQQMRIIAVIDTSRGNMGHAVLSVQTRAGNMVLDNRSTVVYGGSQQTAYVPRFGVNLAGIYTYAAQPRVMMASAY